MLGLNAFDIILAFLMIVSILGGFSKGFTTEALKLVAWAGAVFLTVIAMPLSTTFMLDFFPSEFMAKGLGMALTFMASFFFLGFLAKFIGERIRASFIAPIDRGLGALFGLIRGALVLSAFYLMYSNLVPEDKQPEWLMEARFQPYLSDGVGILEAVTPDLFEKAEEISQSILDKDTDEILADMEDSMPTAGEVVDYTLKQRDEMEDLLEEVADEEDTDG